jgi:hypothetical protein
MIKKLGTQVRLLHYPVSFDQNEQALQLIIIIVSVAYPAANWTVSIINSKPLLQN